MTNRRAPPRCWPGCTGTPKTVIRRSISCCAPTGTITEKFEVQDPASGYYPWAFGTAAYSHLTDWPGGGVVGIHGPYFAPDSIPGHSSHGCIRLRVQDDAKLAGYIGPGTPVLVR